MSLAYSVVVPMRNAATRIGELLDALEGQQGSPEFEVVLVDDGSEDGTPERVRARGGATRLLEGPQRGPAAARNRGLDEARGERIAFLGDDTLPEPDWLARHDAAWRRRGATSGVAVVGYTAWHPRLRPDRFLRFLNEEGLQFGYALIEDPEDVPFNFFYTSNLSADRALLAGERFDERFPYPAWEDVELAYRLRRRGLRLVYEPAARVLHDHPTDFERFRLRQERAGYSAVHFWRLHPELGSFLGLSEEGPPPPTPAPVEWARHGLVRALHPLPFAWRRLWSQALRDPYVRGLHRGWRARGRERGEAR